MRNKKRKPKNKQEISSQSGKKPKKKLRTKQVVDFQFTTRDGMQWKIPCARLKIDNVGGASCLTKENDAWHPVKAHLDWIKIKTVVIKEKKK